MSISISIKSHEKCSEVSSDCLGRRTLLIDPDKGTWTFKHNGFGELVRRESAAGHHVTFRHDALGRVTMRDDRLGGTGKRDGWTIWTYDTAPHGLGRLHRVKEMVHGFHRTHVYDRWGRERDVASLLGGEMRRERTTYDAHGRVFQRFDASRTAVEFTDFGVRHVYNARGHLARVEDARVLRRDGRTGRLLGIQTTRLGGEELQDLSMDWDVGGNLKTRTDGRGGRSLTETFKYDALDRLYAHQVGSGPLSEIKYDGYGNIRSRTGVGTYTYSKSHPGRLDRVAGSTYAHDANGSVTSGGGRSIEYASHDLPTAIQRGLARSEFAYGPDRERLVRRDLSGGELLRETWHLSGVERTKAADGSVELKRFLPGGAMETVAYDAEGAETGRRLDYLLTDHLGSVVAVVEGTETASGQTRWDVREERAFDPWGGCRDPDTWKACATDSVLPKDDGATRRGFTGHETLGAVGLVHMNGRIYDPALGRFLQADPYVQSGSDLQGLNRYAYVLNNPLNAVDPTGHFVFSLAAAAYLAKAGVTAWTLFLVSAAAFADAMLAGADFGQALRSGLIAGITAGAFSGLSGTLPVTQNFGKQLLRGAVFGVVGGMTSVVGGGRFGHGFLSAGLGAGLGGPLADGLAGLGMGEAVAGTVAAVLIGGTSSAATGGKFANGAAWAAMSAAVDASAKSVAKASRRSKGQKVLEDTANIGPERELFGGAVVVRQHGSPEATVSDSDLSLVESELQAIFGEGVSGDRLESYISPEDPLEVILNTSGGNAAYNGINNNDPLLGPRIGGSILTVDLSTRNHWFRNNGNGAWQRMSITRILAHETAHAVLGLRDTGANPNATVQFTDTIMKGVNGTQRVTYGNACVARHSRSC